MKETEIKGICNSNGLEMRGLQETRNNLNLSI